MLPPVAALGSSNVLYISTFSKTLAPGLRIGWLAGDDALIRKATIVKQAADLHTATLAQRATALLLRDFDLDSHLANLRSIYGQRCAAMVSALRSHMPPGTTWIDPSGGMFIWMRLPNGLDAESVFHAALAKQVAFVPGNAFFVDDVRRDFVRLSFSNRPPELINEGIRRLGEVVCAALAGSQPNPATLVECDQVR
jgi:2-aminoadipate transaminase